MEDKSQQYVVNLKDSTVHRFASDYDHHLQESEITITRSRSSQRQILNLHTIMSKREVSRLIELKEQLEVVRQRRKIVPLVDDPDVVGQFAILRKMKKILETKRKIRERLQEKKKELSKLKHLYAKSELEFQEKIQVFKQKSALLRVLGSKMEGQLTKTKERYREVEFHRVIVTGIRRVLLYRLVELLFNEQVRTIFSAAVINSNQIKDDDSVGNCLGYLALFMVIVGTTYEARMWINLNFRGPRSTMRLSDGSTATLHPKQSRYSEVMRQLSQQCYQLMHDTMHLKVVNSGNFYQLCQELTKQILTIR